MGKTVIKPRASSSQWSRLLDEFNGSESDERYRVENSNDRHYKPGRAKLPGANCAVCDSPKIVYYNSSTDLAACRAHLNRADLWARYAEARLLDNIAVSQERTARATQPHQEKLVDSDSLIERNENEQTGPVVS